MRGVTSKPQVIVVSLFDGMSCGQIAMVEEGYPILKYYASEIDKHAIGQTMLNFPDTVQLGSVVDIDIRTIPEKIDLLIGGSPCQSFSFAGKRKGMSTTCEIEITRLEQYLELKEQGFEFEGQSYLFWEYVRILTDIRNYNNPNVFFLLENVEMGAKWERVLSNAIGLFGVHINSALVSAQNRKRIYWTNFRTKPVGLFGELHSDIPQPKDRGILLRDILEQEVHEKYFLSDKMVQSLTNWGNRNAQNGNGFKPEIRDVDEKSAVLTTGAMKSSSTYVKVNKKGVPKANQDKASCFTAGAHSGGNHSDMDLICVSMVGRKTDENGVRKDYDRNIRAKQRFELAPLGKTNCLTTVLKDNLVMQINPSKESGGRQPYQQNRIYDSNGISPALCANKADLLITDRHKRNLKGLDEKANAFLSTSWKGEQANGTTLVIQRPRGNNKGGCFNDKTPTISAKAWEQNNLIIENTLIDYSHRNEGIRYYNDKAPTLNARDYKEPRQIFKNNRIRRLTPTECARLQTVPEWYKWGCSDTQAYKMLGNGWTIDVIRHILRYLPIN